MAKKLIQAWECLCDKCGHGWVTRSSELPKVCSFCKSTKWDDGGEPSALRVIARKMAENPQALGGFGLGGAVIRQTGGASVESDDKLKDKLRKLKLITEKPEQKIDYDEDFGA